ncbi:MAG: hypothetical protein WCY15_04455 [Phenylobacterium sp.]|jgi:oligoendopeptidase F|uniref:hypothetical protein n=1 Tax=Phenylobacterium sp. TaxID=1871053 RepID=UPI002A36F8EC|nr:hypothetical protein [Phenylobacterium sp.]MDX9997896.1 hypothetical protein [Phenylobacterium sp.]
MTDVAWMEPELLTVGEAKIKGFLAAEPGLAAFRFQLTDLARGRAAAAPWPSP